MIGVILVYAADHIHGMTSAPDPDPTPDPETGEDGGDEGDDDDKPVCILDDFNPRVYRTARKGLGEQEIRFGLDPNNELAFVGSESAARTFASPLIGGYENFYTEYRMRLEFNEEFEAFCWPYPEAGDDGFEFEIPQEKIERFNELTISRMRIEF